jgi:hypothetical protein
VWRQTHRVHLDAAAPVPGRAVRRRHEIFLENVALNEKLATAEPRRGRRRRFSRAADDDRDRDESSGPCVSRHTNVLIRDVGVGQRQHLLLVFLVPKHVIATADGDEVETG